jgi:hypothetical protein
MISSIAWVPKGVADPDPKRYEVSNAERELLALLEENDPNELEAKLLAKIQKAQKPAAKVKQHDDLPEDLRMDEYSSDEDEEADMMAIGKLVLGKENDLGDDWVPPDDEIEGDMDASQGSLHESDSDNGSDDDDEDDLADVPDTREYEPVDVEGLEAMGLAHAGTTGGMYANLGDEDDDSDMDEVKLSDDDALIVVAKTEEVCTDFNLMS